MNIKLTFGYLNFYLENTDAKIVDTLMKGVLCDYTYIDGDKVEFISDQIAKLEIVKDGSTPTLTIDDVAKMRIEAENNGNQDRVI